MTVRLPVVIGDDGLPQRLQASDSIAGSGGAFYTSGVASASAGPSSSARTSILPAASAKTSKTVAAGTVGVGDLIDIRLYGMFQTQLAPGALSLFISLGGLDVASVSISNLLGNSTGFFRIEATIFQQASNLLCLGYAIYGAQGVGSNLVGLNNPGTTVATNSMTADRAIDVAAQFATSSATNYITIFGARAQIVKGG